MKKVVFILRNWRMFFLSDETKEIKNNGLLNLRFGGMSPSVLRELSGVYQPFVKAVKELVSNSYDADAAKVDLNFSDDFTSLEIIDDGMGMNPLEFIHQYIRIGKSNLKKPEFTQKYNRARIGGKGIGFLAPARYCKSLNIVTKKNVVSTNYFIVNVDDVKSINLKDLFLQGHNEQSILDLLKIIKVTDSDLNDIEVELIEDFVIYFKDTVSKIYVWYEFDSRGIELNATIDFELLFSMDSSENLEELNTFCKFEVKHVDHDSKDKSYTKIKLLDINEFTRAELEKTGKKNARNIESSSGLNQFLWKLSRIIPVDAKLNDNLPEIVIRQLENSFEQEKTVNDFKVNCSYLGNESIPLQRFVISPTRKYDSINDADLFRIIDLENDNYIVKGFLLGQNSTIFPGEARGILLRVKGVAVGEPTYFGLENLLTGSAKVALTQVSGELNFIKGIDSIKDINPGRDGFYNESPLFNYVKEMFIGNNPDKPSGLLKEVIDSILARSEVTSSLNNFIKKYEAQRQAIFDVSTSISEAAFLDFEIYDNFFSSKNASELLLSPGVKYRAEGKLSSYIVELVEDIEEDYHIDYVNKKLLLNKNADLWKKNINIAGADFEIIFKHGRNNEVLCEVYPTQKKILINWDHPVKNSMNDGEFIKHCIAVIASGLPQDKLNIYNKIFTKK